MINLLILETNLAKVSQALNKVRVKIAERFEGQVLQRGMEHQMKATALEVLTGLMHEGVIDALPEVEVMFHENHHYSIFVQESVLLKKCLGWGGYIHPSH